MVEIVDNSVENVKNFFIQKFLQGKFYTIQLYTNKVINIFFRDVNFYLSVKFLTIYKKTVFFIEKKW